MAGEIEASSANLRAFSILSDATQNCVGVEVFDACIASNSVHHAITRHLRLAPLVATAT